MTTLADQLAQALALVSTGALDEDYSKIATAAAVAEQPSETPSPSSGWGRRCTPSGTP